MNRHCFSHCVFLELLSDMCQTLLLVLLLCCCQESIVNSSAFVSLPLLLSLFVQIAFFWGETIKCKKELNFLLFFYFFISHLFHSLGLESQVARQMGFC